LAIAAKLKPADNGYGRTRSEYGIDYTRCVDVLQVEGRVRASTKATSGVQMEAAVRSRVETPQFVVR